MRRIVPGLSSGASSDSSQRSHGSEASEATDRGDDHFGLFGLPARFALDAAELERAYRLVQSRVHPDRFASAGAAEQRIAMDWAVRANEAYRVLRAPLRRAAYLCERNGVMVDAESAAQLPPGFLDQQMEWREALAEAMAGGPRAHAATDHGVLQRLAAETAAARVGALAELAQLLDVEQDYAAAAQVARRLMFIEKFEQSMAADAGASGAIAANGGAALAPRAAS
jgi:molecular chaperone HscB